MHTKSITPALMKHWTQHTPTEIVNSEVTRAGSCLCVFGNLEVPAVSFYPFAPQPANLARIKRQQTCITYGKGSVSNSNSSSKDWDKVLQNHSSLGNSDHRTFCSSSWPQQGQGPRQPWHHFLLLLQVCTRTPPGTSQPQQPLLTLSPASPTQGLLNSDIMT